MASTIRWRICQSSSKNSVHGDADSTCAIDLVSELLPPKPKHWSRDSAHAPVEEHEQEKVNRKRPRILRQEWRP